MGQEEKDRQTVACRGGKGEEKKRKGKRKQEEEKEKGEGTREEEVTGIPAAMADSSFCLHLSFPVTVPSSCLSGCKTEGLVTHTDTHSPLYLTHLLSLSLF